LSIRLKNIWFKYPGMDKWVLENISYEFKERNIYVIIGPNGSGKTTLFKIASLIYRPLKGSVFTWDRDFWRLKDKEALALRRKIVYVHEKPVFLYGSVLYNVAYGLIIRGYGKEDAFRKARDYINELGLTYLLNKNIDELSAGEAQLVSLVRALILEPRMIFLDEPLAHIDIEKRKIVLDLIFGLRERIGIAIATHDIYLAYTLADEIVLVENGKIKIVEREDLLHKTMFQRKITRYTYIADVLEKHNDISYH